MKQSFERIRNNNLIFYFLPGCPGAYESEGNFVCEMELFVELSECLFTYGICEDSPLVMMKRRVSSMEWLLGMMSFCISSED